MTAAVARNRKTAAIQSDHTQSSAPVGLSDMSLELILIARALAAQINVSISEDCVWKIRETPALKNAYDYDQRWRLLDGAFDVDSTLVAGKTLLLFDDLYRSGATMNAITSALYDKGGAKDIFALTLTRTRSRQ